ncbi:MAG: metallophosphoesterase family protein [Planctomycetales bacterium]|nr:metallophosphoesterase family protein [Planctomycetales bacterium]
MKRALISDIHANWEALTAVLDDIRQAGVSTVYCLGDIIGYGPDPCRCIDKVIATANVTILGNHDQASLFDPKGFNPVALQSVYWTRDQLDSLGTRSQINRRWDFLGELPRMHEEGEFLFVHGSPRDPTNEYVFPEDVLNSGKMEALFGRIELYCFQGHTHIPGVFTLNREFYSPEEIDYQFQLTGEKTMINVGSVGQPRDGDPRACYVILDEATGRVEFRRVAYGYSQTAEKIYNIDDLPDMLGERLASGR